MEQSKIQEAIHEFEKILEIDPDNMMAHSLLGSVYVKKGDYQSAIDEYQRILSLNTDDEEIQTFLKRAIEQAAAVQKSNSDDKPKRVSEEKKPSGSTSTASLTIADLYMKQDHVDKAIEVYEEILVKDPQNSAVRQKLSEANRKKQERFAAVPEPSKLEKADLKKSSDKKEQDANKHEKLDKENDLKFTSEFFLELMEGSSKGKPSDVKPSAVPAPVKEMSSTKSDLSLRPKAEPTPVLENPQTETTAIPFSPEKIGSLKSALSELSAVEGILKCFLMRSDGIAIVSIGESSNNDLNKQAAVIFKDTQVSAGKLDQGELKQVLVTAESGHVLLVSCLQHILVVLANGHINLGLLKIALDSALRKFDKLT
jgi:predicted regulator of Ras-like GTPase activity (Roadblock/LC7/MglB family)/DNA-binding SARP family transcriptional activator